MVIAARTIMTLFMIALYLVVSIVVAIGCIGLFAAFGYATEVFGYAVVGAVAVALTAAISTLLIATTEPKD